jgi:hypothetical protein
LIEHDLIGKPVSTFPDHALKKVIIDVENAARHSTGSGGANAQGVLLRVLAILRAKL